MNRNRRNLSRILSLENLLLRGDFKIVGVILIVFRPRDFTNVGAVLNVKSTLGLKV